MTINISIVMFLLITSFISGEDIEESVYISGLKTKYHSTEDVSFKIVSKLDTGIHLSVYIEEYYNKKWIITELFKKEISKAREVMYIEPLGHIHVSWNSTNITVISLTGHPAKVKKGLPGKYRFRVDWGFISDSLCNKYISESFILR